MALLFEAHLQIISAYICIEIIYTICPDNYGKERTEKKNVPSSFSYANLYILRNRHVVLNTTSNKSWRKWKENVNGEVQEEKQEKLFGLDLNAVESPTDAVWNLPI